MSFLRPQQDFDKPQLGEEFYRGIVVDNVDPQQLHRVKIRIEELHGTADDIPDENLPWAMHFRPSFLGGNVDLSNAAIPRIDSEVIVTHIRGEIYQPAYMFELAHNNNRMSQAEEDYPESYVLRDSDGNFWHVNMEQDKLDILFNGTQCIEITVDNFETIGQDQTLDVGRDKTDTVGRDETRTIGNDQSEDIVNNSARTVGVDQTEDIGNNLTETVGNDYSNDIGNNSVETIGNDETNNVGNNSTENITQKKEINATRLVINTSADVDINAGGNVTVDAPQILLNGSGGGVLTQESINPVTGTPFPDGSTTVKAGDG